jgi:hypothetical protein
VGLYLKNSYQEKPEMLDENAPIYGLIPACGWRSIADIRFSQERVLSANPAAAPARLLFHHRHFRLSRHHHSELKIAEVILAD